MAKKLFYIFITGWIFIKALLDLYTDLSGGYALNAFGDILVAVICVIVAFTFMKGDDE